MIIVTVLPFSDNGCANAAGETSTRAARKPMSRPIRAFLRALFPPLTMLLSVIGRQARLDGLANPFNKRRRRVDDSRHDPLQLLSGPRADVEVLLSCLG